MRTLYTIILLFVAVNWASAQNEIQLDNKMFSGNWFNDLDEAKKDPDKVLYLDLSLQKLKSFPQVIFTFRNLKELHLAYNYWPGIPDGLSRLQHLELLDLSGNYYMNRLPADITQLTGLEKLMVKDNKLAAGEVDKARRALLDTEVVVD